MGTSSNRNQVLGWLGLLGAVLVLSTALAVLLHLGSDAQPELLSVTPSAIPSEHPLPLEKNEPVSGHEDSSETGTSSQESKPVEDGWVFDCCGHGFITPVGDGTHRFSQDFARACLR